MSMQFTARIPARSFGFESEHTVLGFEPTHIATLAARSITPDPEHLFEAEFFEEMRLWWEWDDTRSPLYISGPSGCGKTSTVLQFLARVHAPAVTVTCRRRTEKSDLIGQWGMDGSGGFAWFDGPAAIAWRYGCVLVINEFSLAPPEVWVAVNDLFEGDALYIERTGGIPTHASSSPTTAAVQEPVLRARTSRAMRRTRAPSSASGTSRQSGLRRRPKPRF